MVQPSLVLRLVGGSTFGQCVWRACAMDYVRGEWGEIYMRV
eukprot:CAMPEP_0185042386 /NCGR_PEP_ID=MMETSP1103-20130426/42322_1 /TAXON_ID=36769 /ORGANISM="Paraphysomonas bandaiensis, Strain Caron Lab Isolate" /LENGTH=40 /DNA_ID= /DNA_START= /DNA_END= /DNA_ORIENTATION=